MRKSMHAVRIHKDIWVTIIISTTQKLIIKTPIDCWISSIQCQGNQVYKNRWRKDMVKQIKDNIVILSKRK